MAERTDNSWPECEHEGCIGIQLAVGRMCLAHADEKDLVAALDVINETGVVDGRGVPFTSALLERVLTAAPRGDNGKAVLEATRFERATFSGDATFAGVTFTGGAIFEQATFTGYAWFGEAAFTGPARFGRVTFTRHAWFQVVAFRGDALFTQATFTGDARFERAAFTGHATFDGATFTGDAMFQEAAFTGDATFYLAAFRGDARFERAAFTGDAWFHLVTFRGDATFDGTAFSRDAKFDGVTFTGDARFSGVTFTGDAMFDQAAFTGDARFSGAAFTGDARFSGVTFTGDARFDGTRFEQAREFGPLLAYSLLILDDARFAEQIWIEVSAARVYCRRAQFPAGVHFRLRWAWVVLDETDFPSASLLSGISRLADAGLAEREKQIAQRWLRDGEISAQPQLLSLRRANVAGLVVNNVGVVDCRFVGAPNLDMLRLEANLFAAAPSLTWEGRQVIAEERAWRAGRRRWGWNAPAWPDWLGEQPTALPGEIAGVYRALRKGREDNKDEPGAADFYYGEMEMRRHARPFRGGVASSSRGRAERGILTAYWLVSGYGLRAWRAITWLAALTALLAFAFHTIGFAEPPRPASYWTSLLYAFRATLSLTDSQVTLTAWGQLVQGLLRLTGPVLLGLALLALRGRVKR